MSQDNIFEIALSLPQAERADLASQLLRSLGGESAAAIASPTTAAAEPAPLERPQRSLINRLNNETGEEFDLARVMNDVQKITQELFPGKCDFTNEFDPEYPDDRYVVVNVEASGEPKELVDRSCRWSERIRQLSPNLFGKLRLSIVPR